MKTVETIDDSDLLHGNRQYDPEKARQYYLRTRHLTGRKKGVAVDPAAVERSKNSPAVRKAAKAKRIAQVKARHEALEAQLAKLKDLMALLTKRAKERSGVDTSKTADEPNTASSSSSAASSGGGSAGTSKKSASQKAKDAKNAKEKYDKEIKPLTQQNKELESQIKDVHKKIADMRKQIRASADKTQKRTNPKSPPANKQSAPRQNPKPRTAV